MSEFIGTRCDGCSKLTEVAVADVYDKLRWKEDDRGGHACGDCQVAADDLEDSQVDGEDLAVFGSTLAKVADAILESPEIIQRKAERQEAFEKLKAESLKEIRDNLKGQYYSQEYIKDFLDDAAAEMDAVYHKGTT